MLNASSHLREFENLRLDLEKKVVWYQNEPVHLPAKAVEVLCELVEKRGELVTKDELLNNVWHDSFVEENVLSQNIHHLRKAFREMNIPESTIQTIPRRGYRFAGNVRDVGDELLFEHEIVERDFLTEINDASLFRRRRLLLSLVVLIPTVVLMGLSVWWFATPAESGAVKGIRSIAVLPLKPLNGPEQNQTFSLGLTDSLITRLASLNKFAVRPFSATAKYTESGKDGLTFGRELKTDSVLEGTIQQVDGRVRVSLSLFDARDGAQIWSDNFDETESDILKLQDTISTRVAQAILTKLHPREEALLAKRPTANSEAYLLYIAGRERWLQRNGKAESLAFYQKAIELDANFALPFLGIADEYAFTYETKIAEEALAKAIELDPQLSEAHATRGFLQMFHHWDWQAAEISFRRALELAPNSSKARHWYGVYLSIQGRFDESLQEMEQARALDPTALVIMTDIAELYYFKHDYDRAETELQKVLEIDPTFLNARQHLIKVRYKKGASYFLEDAAFAIFIQNLRKSAALSQDFDPRELEQALIRKDEKTLRDTALNARLAAVKNRPDAHLSLSMHYLITGENEKSLDSLEKAWEARSFVMPFVAIDPLFDPVRSDPRFKEIVRNMNLAEN